MGSSPPIGARTTTDRVLRNRRPARRIHAAGYLLIGFLALSGIAVLGEGSRPLEAVLGGHAAAAWSHRWGGVALLAAVLAVLAFRPRVVLRFLAASARFRRSDLGWFATYPSFLLSRRSSPGWHDGHFDPGQRLMNLLVVGALLVLSVTGLVMTFPGAVVPSAFAWSRRLHLFATWLLLLAVGGHVLVASGVLPCYRGVARAMHGDGRVPRTLALALWPRWVEERAAETTPRDRRSSDGGPVGR